MRDDPDEDYKSGNREEDVRDSVRAPVYKCTSDQSSDPCRLDVLVPTQRTVPSHSYPPSSHPLAPDNPLLVSQRSVILRQQQISLSLHPFISEWRVTSEDIDVGFAVLG